MTRPLRLSSKSEKRHMCAASWQAIVRARRGGSRRQLTSEVLHEAGLNYFMREGVARRRSEGTLVAVHYGVYVPRLPARPQDCIIDIRPTPVPLHSTHLCTSGEKSKTVCACMYVHVYMCAVLEKDYSWIFAGIDDIRVMRPAENRTDSLDTGSDIVMRIINMQNDFKIDCQTSIWIFP